MDLNSEVVYWVALAHLKNIKKKVVYNLVDQLDKKQITFKDFFKCARATQYTTSLFKSIRYPHLLF